MSALNNINAFSSLFYFSKNSLKHKKYKMSRKAAAVDNVIFIITETLSASHIPLYGYHRNTTPALLKMSEDNNFFYSKAYSAAVSTRLSMSLLLNVTREPDNISQVMSRESNMFNIAKQQDMNTYFFTSQNLGVLSYASGTFFDKTLYCNRNRRLEGEFKKKRDYLLIDCLKNEKLSNKGNFIVLNTQNLHAPYSDHYRLFEKFNKYPIEGTKKQRMENDYDNAMLCFDDWLSQTLKFFSETLSGETFVFITGDHGELFGDNSLYGHGHLNRKCTTVPFILIVLNMKENGEKYIDKLKIKNKSLYSHYEIGNMILELLGYNLYNSNQSDNSHFIGYVDFCSGRNIKFNTD